jgi:hypothetical protein
VDQHLLLAKSSPAFSLDSNTFWLAMGLVLVVEGFMPLVVALKLAQNLSCKFCNCRMASCVFWHVQCVDRTGFGLVVVLRRAVGCHPGFFCPVKSRF